MYAIRSYYDHSATALMKRPSLQASLDAMLLIRFGFSSTRGSAVGVSKYPSTICAWVRELRGPPIFART